MLVPFASRAPAHSSSVLHSQSTSVISDLARPSSRAFGPPFPDGYGEELQFPVTSVVTPW